MHHLRDFRLEPKLWDFWTVNPNPVCCWHAKPPGDSPSLSCPFSVAAVTSSLASLRRLLLPFSHAFPTLELGSRFHPLVVEALVGQLGFLSSSGHLSKPPPSQACSGSTPFQLLTVPAVCKLGTCSPETELGQNLMSSELWYSVLP